MPSVSIQPVECATKPADKTKGSDSTTSVRARGAFNGHPKALSATRTKVIRARHHDKIQGSTQGGKPTAKRAHPLRGNTRSRQGRSGIPENTPAHARRRLPPARPRGRRRHGRAGRHRSPPHQSSIHTQRTVPQRPKGAPATRPRRGGGARSERTRALDGPFVVAAAPPAPGAGRRRRRRSKPLKSNVAHLLGHQINMHASLEWPFPVGSLMVS